ncbi:insulinase family protein [Altererythrobacter confluentis]|uniref:Insulinase family protein n=1 Tax=Allopontixanthobacter confluentis TaxID=1849021 RepID=A0A6L7GFU5_9SPHN|nr:M16 family metallopeptidase [Allopontixanthobacter confluentis]MXP14540.1 insulinase family protein [Allopontixanthobacter confluentis]
MKILAKRHLLAASVLALAIAAPMHSSTFAQTAATPRAAAAAESSWGVVNVDLPEDEAIRYGMLANGFKYALRKNETPKGSTSVRMHVEVGSLAEADNEQGLAHFLEHMAFNGSKNVPEGEMVKLLERQGLSFGPDTNATTSFTQTTYQLDVPVSNDEAVDTALMLMRETASNLTLTPEAVERERGVIQSERQLRNSAGLRSAVAQLAMQLPGTQVSKRLPIGTVEVVSTAPASRIKDFYNRYYRPENTTLVLVGDFDMDAMEAKVRKEFADWQPAGPKGKSMDYGLIDPSSALTVGSFSDPSVQTMAIFQKAKPYQIDPNSIEANRESLQLMVASRIMSDRFQKLALQTDAPILGGAALFNPLEEVAMQSLFLVVGKEGEWQSAVTVGEQELRRALQFGFTNSEIEEQVANITASFENAAKQQDTRKNAVIADNIMGSIVDRKVVMTPAGQLAVFNALRPVLTAEATTLAFRENWEGGPNNLFLTSKETVANFETAIRSTLDASQQMAVNAPVEVAAKAFAYDGFGTAGEIASDVTIADLGIRAIQFENGVRLNIRQTDFETGKVHYSLRVGDGLRSMSANSGGLNFYMQNVMAVGGLGEHDVQELQKILVGKTVNLALIANQDAVASSGVTTAEDAGMQMKILAALVTNPGYRPEADTAWQNALPTINTQTKASPISVLQSDFARVLASGDSRFGRGTPDELASMDMAKVKSLIGDQLAHGAIELAVVGDIDEQSAIDIVAETFGALPPRASSAPAAAELRAVKFPADKAPIMLYHDGQPDQGLALAVWPTDDDSDQRDDVARDLLAAAMGLLLNDEIREKLGASYTTQAFSEASSVYPDYGFIAGFAVADPAKMEGIYAAIHDVSKQLRDQPLSEDEILRARKPLLEQLEKQDRENSAWVGMTSVAQSKPERLNRWRQRIALVDGISADEIQATARKYLIDDRLLEVRIVPQPTSK